MTPGLWFVVAAFGALVLLFIVGVVRLALEAHALAVRAASIEVPAIDLDRTQRTLEKLQRDADAMAELFTRLQAALRDIGIEMRAMMRAFSRE